MIVQKFFLAAVFSLSFFSSLNSYAGSSNTTLVQNQNVLLPVVQSGQQSISENSGINGGLENSLGPIFSPLSLPENQIPSVQAEIVTGRQFHVAAGGSDQNDGSEASPWKTIQYAVSQLQAGDTVYISEGTYQESVQISSSGSTDAWITLEGV